VKKSRAVSGGKGLGQMRRPDLTKVVEEVIHSGSDTLTDDDTLPSCCPYRCGRRFKNNISAGNHGRYCKKHPDPEARQRAHDRSRRNLSKTSSGDDKGVTGQNTGRKGKGGARGKDRACGDDGGKLTGKGGSKGGGKLKGSGKGSAKGGGKGGGNLNKGGRKGSAKGIPQHQHEQQDSMDGDFEGHDYHMYRYDDDDLKDCQQYVSCTFAGCKFVTESVSVLVQHVMNRHQAPATPVIRSNEEKGTSGSAKRRKTEVSAVGESRGILEHGRFREEHGQGAHVHGQGGEDGQGVEDGQGAKTEDKLRQEQVGYEIEQARQRKALAKEKLEAFEMEQKLARAQSMREKENEHQHPYQQPRGHSNFQSKDPYAQLPYAYERYPAGYNLGEGGDHINMHGQYTQPRYRYHGQTGAMPYPPNHGHGRLQNPTGSNIGNAANAAQRLLIQQNSELCLQQAHKHQWQQHMNASSTGTCIGNYQY